MSGTRPYLIWSSGTAVVVASSSCLGVMAAMVDVKVGDVTQVIHKWRAKYECIPVIFTLSFQTSQYETYKTQVQWNSS